MSMDKTLNEEMRKDTAGVVCADNDTKTSDVQNGTSDKKTNGEKRMFTETELEKVVRERLRRDRKVNEELLSVKKLLKEAGRKGLIEGNSYAEMAKNLEEIILTKAIEEEQKQTVAPTTENDENMSPIPEENVEKDAEGGEITTGEKAGFFEVLSQIKKKYPSADRLLSGEGLSRFAEGRSGSAEEIFGAYHEFMTYLEKDMDGAASHASLSSTAFSSDAAMSDTNFGLSRQQMEMAKSEGLSYREYASLLEAVPKRNRKTV